MQWLNSLPWLFQLGFLGFALCCYGAAFAFLLKKVTLLHMATFSMMVNSVAMQVCLVHKHQTCFILDHL
ncbi:hypothetical protein EPR50_G00090100 [Perca flavescens]|uniref:Uncharacterized protein n=1 Tax=Perca flavescens TaxID=8167 RepID=A0A484D3Q9_PERFV|nr:hypothetical protein EPR50_G00090100 [Perca flavescens]